MDHLNGTVWFWTQNNEFSGTIRQLIISGHFYLGKVDTYIVLYFFDVYKSWFWVHVIGFGHFSHHIPAFSSDFQRIDCGAMCARGTPLRPLWWPRRLVTTLGTIISRHTSHGDVCAPSERHSRYAGKRWKIVKNDVKMAESDYQKYTSKKYETI